MLSDLPALSEPIADELRVLADKACDQQITGEECRRLTEILRDQRAAQSYWLAYMAVDARLRREFGFPRPQILPAEIAAAIPAPPADLQSSPLPRVEPAVKAVAVSRSTRWWILGAVLAASLLLVCSIALMSGVSLRGMNSPPAPHAMATLTRGRGLEWDDNAHEHVVGKPLSLGRHRLVLGIAEISFRNGAVVVLEAPAELEIVGPARAFVHSGQVVVRAEGDAKGFVLETPRATVVDLGTEFGVKVASHDTEVDVFEGSVSAREKNLSDPAAPEQHLLAGQAIRYGGTGNAPPQISPSTPQRFVRRFPEPQSRPDCLVPYNRSRWESVHVVPAPAKVVIDGDLTDWNHRGRFRLACDPPYDETYFVEGNMMYDRDFLYIGAHVGDPSPMRNIIDPSADAECAWRGGAVQVRLSTDRSLRWPLDAEAPHLLAGRRLPRPSDVNDRLVHLTMWYYAPAGQACLQIDYGMDLHGRLVNPAGYRGAFRRDRDGRGYVAEYAIPWALLHAADNPPRAGDVLAASWNVHWSDDSGRIWQGHLMDILNPQESDWTFRRAATWGRAIYDRPAAAIAPPH